MKNKKPSITEVVLRDGQQSLIATRMKTKDMLPVLSKMDKVGFSSVEVWGGATYDVCLRFLNEDPWERLKVFKKYFKNTQLQMLLRGKNLVGYKQHHDSVIKLFISNSIKKGINIFRIFDSLNDIWANGHNVTEKIRTTEVSSNVSAVSAISQVREKMVAIQRAIAEGSDCVLEGRDIGTVVFPNADYKFFLVADLEIRAKRRLVELEKIGEISSLSELKSDIQNRDQLDSTRDISPLVQAEDAIIIDTGKLTIDEQIEKILEIINK